MNIKSSDLIKLNQIDMAHEVGFFIVGLFTPGFLLHAFEQHTPSHYSVQHLLCDAQVPLGNGNGWVWISGFDAWLSRLEKSNRCRAECGNNMKMHQLC